MSADPMNAKFRRDFSNKLIAELMEHGQVRLPGLGLISVVDQPARTGRNPKTGEAFPVPAKRRLRFKQSDLMAPQLNP